MLFPKPIQAPGPSSLQRPRGVIPVEDTTGVDIGRGVQSAAQSVGQVANAVDQMANRQREQEVAVDLSRAEAFKTAAFLDIQNAAAKDPDYATFGDRYTPRVQDTVTKAADLIRDPRVRERWAADQEAARLKMVDAINQVGTGKRDDLNRVALETTLGDNMRVIIDPTAPTEVRQKMRSDMLGSITMAEATGLITPAQSLSLRDKYVRGSDSLLAQNIAELDILSNPQRAMVGLAIPGVDGASSVLDAQLAVDGAYMIEPSLAKIGADLLGDVNLPEDPAELAAYLSDPVKAQDYVETLQAHLSDRYRGDMTAVIIAMDPNGGTELADKWVASKHDTSVLPANVRTRYEEVLGRMTPMQPQQRIPIVAEPGVDLANVDAKVLGRLETLQSLFGRELPVISGYRDPEHNKEVGGATKSQHIERRAVDIDVSALDEEQRVRLIQMASSAGFTGIGVYKNSLHLDTGELRAWGPSHKDDSVPAWAKDVVAQHVSGQVAPMPALYAGVAPEYAAMSFDQRLTMYNKAKAALTERSVNMRASLQTIMANAPAAIQAAGTYTGGDMPTATQFVQAFGAEEGIQRYREFNTSVDVARSVYGMKSMTSQAIQEMMQSAIPSSTGNGAALEQERYKVLAAAGKAVLEQRAKDPAGYTLDAVPAVAQAFEAANEDPKLMPAALTMMAEAQRELGIEDGRLLPSAMSAAAVDAFNDPNLPASQRMASVAGLVLSTNDPEVQDTIFRQLVGDKLPEFTAPVLNAMRRGDEAGAAALMRAVLFNPADLKAKLPANITQAEIETRLLEDVFGAGQIGAITYGISGGMTGDSFDSAASASELLARDVKMRLIDGSAGGDLSKAIELAKADLFGDDVVIRGNGGFMGFNSGSNVMVTAPPDVPEERLRKGFDNLATVVRSSLRSLLMGSDDPRDAAVSAETKKWTVDNYVDAALAEGFFTNGDGYLSGERGYVFFDPNSNSPVPGPDGKPIVFSLSDVIAASGGVNFSGSPDDRITRR